MKLFEDFCFAKIFPCSTRLPFRIRAAGHVIMGDLHKEKVRLCNFVELFWGIKGSCKFSYPDGEYTLKAGEVCFYTSGMIHDFTANPGGFELCWMSFEGHQADDFFKGFHTTVLPHYAGNCPLERFNLLIKDLGRDDPAAVYSQLSIGMRILITALTPPNADTERHHLDYAEIARQLADEHFSNFETTVQFLADQLQVHRGYLSRIFHEKYGTTLSDYILKLRLEYAQELLITTELPAGDISTMCGFHDYGYFMRFFRKRTGMSPGQFRKKGSVIA